MWWINGRSGTPGPASPPLAPNGARREARARWASIHGAAAYMTSPVHRAWANELYATGMAA